MPQLITLRFKRLFILIITAIFFNCSITENNNSEIESIVDIDPNNSNDQDNNNDTSKVAYNILSLGDSYTIGESVCASCRFPEQLKDSLNNKFNTENRFQLNIIAQTGWTTTNLINAIDSQTLDKDYDLVTLLIGVNNQYQRKPFSIYETEFPQLLNTSISLAKGDKSNVIVVSIPDYAYTPYGRGNTNISNEIDTYNTFAKNYCLQNEITFVNITDITRLGLINTDLVATDGLHPSTLAYSFFVGRILPFALDKISD